MMLSNYEGKISHILGVTQVDLSVGTLKCSTLFMIISSKENYNMFHQRISIWHPNGIVENIEADQSYFMAEVNHVDGKHFDVNLAKISHAIKQNHIHTIWECIIFSKATPHPWLHLASRNNGRPGC